MQCSEEWRQIILFNEKGRKRFTKEEDNCIREMVNKYGEHNWDLIAEKMNKRSARQLRERWRHYLSQNITKNPWNSEEDFILEYVYWQIGPRWSTIALYLPGRTDVNVKNRWTLLERRKSKIFQNNMKIQNSYLEMKAQNPTIANNVNTSVECNSSEKNSHIMGNNNEIDLFGTFTDQYDQEFIQEISTIFNYVN